MPTTILAALVASGFIFATDPPIKVPAGKPVMIDGHFSAKEWDDAAEKAMSHSIRLYFKQAGEFVFICVRLPEGRSGFTDLYLATPDGPAVNVHASAKLGERVLRENNWPEWRWWNNADWVANVSRVNSFEKRTFLPEDVREFQIRRSRFPAKEWLAMFEVSVAAGGGFKTVTFPEGASNKDKATWVRLELEN
jgi:hypothetical protein